MNQSIQVHISNESLTQFFRGMNGLSLGLVIYTIINLSAYQPFDGIVMIPFAILIIYTDYFSNKFTKKHAQFLTTLGGRGLVFLYLGLKACTARYQDLALINLLFANSLIFMFSSKLFSSFELPEPIAIEFNILKGEQSIELPVDEKTTLLDIEAQTEVVKSTQDVAN